MTEVASASLNTFGPSPKADFEPPSEQTISLSYGQLQELIKEAVEQAIEPLHEEIAQDRQEIEALRSTVASLETALYQEICRICLDIAYDRKRLAKLEHPTKEPGKTETARAEKIEKYLASRPDHKATFETLKGHLGVDKFALNDAIKTLMEASPGRFGITRTPGDKRKRTLIMLPR
jgi:hypothetical protein